MTENLSYNLFTYNSWFLVLSMVGFGVLGARILLISPPGSNTSF